MTTAKKNYYIGVDIGGTNMKAVLFDGKKTVMDYSLGTPKDSLDHLIIMILALIEPLQKKALENKKKIEGIGLGTAGIVDTENHKIIDSPNLPILNGINLSEIISQKLSLPVKIDNDAECFLRAEAVLGAAEKYHNVYGLTLGTGIGGAWWFNSNIYYGERGLSEPSRMIVDFANGLTLEKAYQKLAQNNPLNLAVDAYHGDELARRAYQEIGRLLGIACINIVNLIDPEAIIFGGGVMESENFFIPTLKKTLDEHMPSTSLKKVKLLKAKLGNEAGAIGAALLFN
ncbi:MAG: ROK family protein [Patescibacteria group bacterium]|jgi:glucokinase